MPAPLGFFLHFQFQGILAMLIAMPFYWIRHLSSFNILSIIAIILIIIGIIGETVADFQLNNFKKKFKGEVCNIGIWAYSRHPNYFFEFLVWLGFGLSSILISPIAFISLISPVVLFIIMYFITGPITEEQSIKSKGEKFIKYQKVTSYFFLKKPNYRVNQAS